MAKMADAAAPSKRVPSASAGKRVQAGSGGGGATPMSTTSCRKACAGRRVRVISLWYPALTSLRAPTTSTSSLTRYSAAVSAAKTMVVTADAANAATAHFLQLDT